MHLEPFIFQREGALIGMRRQETDDNVASSVNCFSLRPLGRDEFAVFTMDLCHNRIDRHYSRFPDEELTKINEMVPGRPLMERHDLRGTLPRGTFFRSQLHSAADRLCVRPDVYVLRTKDNEDFILNIEGGVYRETSIGFSFRLPECSVCGKDLRTCDHVPGRTYGDALCHYVMRDVLEVIEGSVVPAGSQRTAFVAQTRSLALPKALEDGRRAFHRPVELVTRATWDDE
jgi:hypothetical protein